MGQEATQVARIVLPDGTPVWARISGGPDLPAPGELSYTDTGFTERVGASVESLHSLVTGVARSLAEPLRAVRPDEVSVQFGIELTAKAGKIVSMLADGEAKASIAVTLTWNGGPPDLTASPGPSPGTTPETSPEARPEASPGVTAPSDAAMPPVRSAGRPDATPPAGPTTLATPEDAATLPESAVHSGPADPPPGDPGPPPSADPGPGSPRPGPASPGRPGPASPGDPGSPPPGDSGSPSPGGPRGAHGSSHAGASPGVSMHGGADGMPAGGTA